MSARKDRPGSLRAYRRIRLLSVVFLMSFPAGALLIRPNDCSPAVGVRDALLGRYVRERLVVELDPDEAGARPMTSTGRRILAKYVRAVERHREIELSQSLKWLEPHLPDGCGDGCSVSKFMECSDAGARIELGSYWIGR